MQGDGSRIAYLVRVHTKARSLKLTVYPDTRVVVTVPSRVPVRMRETLIKEFVLERTPWIQDALSHFNSLDRPTSHSAKEIAHYKKEALALVTERLQHFNMLYEFNYTKVSIRSQKTRWGSCSSKGALSFNYKIALLPPELAEYLVVHELCHLGEMNHSPRFWKLVGKAVPEYARLRKDLRKIK